MLIDPVKRIEITQSMLLQLFEHARNELPYEAAALILGVLKSPLKEGMVAIGEKIIFTENVDKSVTTFSIQPEILYQAYMEAEKTNRMIVAIFHSHPAPPQPSSTDLLFMRLNPCVWIIAGINKDEIKAYQLRKGELHKVDLIITDSNP